MQKRKLGNLEVSALGLGCMGMTHSYGNKAPKSEMIALIHKAIDWGVDFFDTAQVYGPYTNESLLGEALKGKREKAIIATKFGWDLSEKNVDDSTKSYEVIGLNSQPKYIKKSVEDSLKRLQTDYIDLLYQHRVDPNVPIEDVAGCVGELIKEGKVRFFGLSEPSVQTLLKAHATTPVVAVQNEYSLWFREGSAEMFAALESINAGFVAFSPLGKGFLTGAIQNENALSKDDFRHTIPRFSEENLQSNRKLLQKLEEFTRLKNATLAQIALAWVLASKPYMVAIPGTTKLERLRQNLDALAINFSASELQAIDEILQNTPISGARYNEYQLSLVGK